jgi:hypothetical protein
VIEAKVTLDPTTAAAANCEALPPSGDCFPQIPDKNSISFDFCSNSCHTFLQWLAKM